MSKPRSTLVVFAKAPVAGRVKTRLQPTLSAAQAARLHEAFVRDVVARHQRPRRLLRLWRADDPDHPFWASLGVSLATQSGADLGVRMARALTEELREAHKVVIIGTDSPSLPPRLVDEAFALLDEVPVVLGPACDGGYYLVGARGEAPRCFTDIPWGTEAVLLRTLDALLDVPHRLLDFWYDVDRPADLALLQRQLRALPARERPVHTARILESTQ